MQEQTCKYNETFNSQAGKEQFSGAQQGNNKQKTRINWQKPNLSDFSTLHYHYQLPYMSILFDLLNAHRPSILTLHNFLPKNPILSWLSTILTIYIIFKINFVNNGITSIV